jgi:uncharacterized protein with NRDE domain
VCTIVLAVDVLADAPLAVAATREEARDRPSEPPAIRWTEAGPAVLAPLDLLAGGTWIGVNERGLGVAVANRWTDDPVAGDRSRGLLTRDALATSSVDAALDAVQQALERDRYAPFRMVIAAGRTGDTTVVEWPGGSAPAVDPAVRSLSAGIHVVTNVGVDGDVEIPATRRDAGERQVGVGERVRAALDPDRLAGEAPDADAWIDRAATVLSDHDVGACVHGEGGTRSASLLAIDEAGAVTYRFADGPPCETPFRIVWADRPIRPDAAFEG